MKPISTAYNLLAAVAFVILAAGCASNNLLDKENVAVAAGFKVITPSKPAQVALLLKLPPDKVTPVTFGGKAYYVLPDGANHQAYVGGPKQYQAYRQLRRKQLKDSDNQETSTSSVQVVEVNAMNWSEWGGWDGVGGPDGMGWPGWY